MKMRLPFSLGLEKWIYRMVIILYFVLSFLVLASSIGDNLSDRMQSTFGSTIVKIGIAILCINSLAITCLLLFRFCQPQRETLAFLLSLNGLPMIVLVDRMVKGRWNDLWSPVLMQLVALTATIAIWTNTRLMEPRQTNSMHEEEV